MTIAELMILGFISLLIFFQNYIAGICISKSAGNIMLPCNPGEKDYYFMLLILGDFGGWNQVASDNRINGS
ncbi:MLO protein [Carex littledalei]|uniref:MLO protein n=1 Tax=Carex littledalei TaxID=544730 RepID=A0A833QV45_9POAL|nr:MLO protein [Carex littledalei]